MSFIPIVSVLQCKIIMWDFEDDVSHGYGLSRSCHSVYYFSEYIISVTVLCSEIVTEIGCCCFLNQVTTKVLF
jgi:hypothetical protein